MVNKSDLQQGEEVGDGQEPGEVVMPRDMNEVKDRSGNRHLKWTCPVCKPPRTFCDHTTCMIHIVKEHPSICEPEWFEKYREKRDKQVQCKICQEWGSKWNQSRHKKYYCKGKPADQ